MRKITYYSLAAALVLLFAPHALAVLNTISYTANYNSSPTIGTDTLGGVTYATVSYDGLYNGGDPGKPSLPIEYIRFSVPYNATNFTVSASPGRWVNHTLSNLIYPCQAPWIPDETGTPHPITLPDTASYYSGTTYPSQFAWVVDEGFLAGENHIVTVAVMPFSYTHTSTSDVVKKARYMNVWLDYTLSATLSMYPIVRNDSALRQEGYELTQSMVVNPNQVTSFAPADLAISFDSIGGIIGPLNGGYGLNGGGGQVIPPDPPTPGDYYEDSTLVNPDHEYNETDENNIHYPYLIVTTSNLYNSVRRIAALKRQKGYNVKVVTMDQVLRDSTALVGDIVNGQITRTDPAGVLRQFLRNYYQKYRTRFVLFAGDGVPFRCIDMNHLDGTFVPNMPTDLYFSDLTGDWSLPLSFRKMDVKPELYVGRILATKDEEFNNYTDKLFRYELNPGNGDYSYLNRLLYSEGLEFHQKNEAEYVNRSYSKLFSDTTHLIESKNASFPSGTDIIDQINSTGYGYLSILNHAGPSGFITCKHNNTNLYLWAVDTIHLVYNNYIYNGDTHTGNGINNMLNKWYPNICYSIGCTTMPFDRAPGYEDVVNNIGNSFTTGKDYGGPAFLGNTRAGAYERKSSLLENIFGQQIVDGYYKIGMAEALSKNFYPSHKTELYILMIHNLLGDPEFELWTDEPNHYSNVTVTRTDTTITVTGISESSTIIAFHNNKYYEPWKKTVSSSNVTLKASPNSPLMLYKHNMIPYIAPLYLQNVVFYRSQYIIANDVLAGTLIDSNRTAGNVVIRHGVSYEIEAKGNVTLQDGFIVEKGAEFAVYPSSF